MQNQQVLLDALQKKNVIQFNPTIRVRLKTDSPPMWIDNISLVKDNIMLQVSTHIDTFKMNIDKIPSKYLPEIEQRVLKN